MPGVGSHSIIDANRAEQVRAARKGLPPRSESGRAIPRWLPRRSASPSPRRASDLRPEFHGASAKRRRLDSRGTAAPGEGEPDVIRKLRSECSMTFVPGMWAEMLNDRSFEGRRPDAATAFISMGRPTSATANGTRISLGLSTPTSPSGDHAAPGSRLPAIRPPLSRNPASPQNWGGVTLFSGYFRTDNPALQSGGVTQDPVAGWQHG